MSHEYLSTGASRVTDMRRRFFSAHMRSFSLTPDMSVLYGHECVPFFHNTKVVPMKMGNETMIICYMSVCSQHTTYPYRLEPWIGRHCSVEKEERGLPLEGWHKAEAEKTNHLHLAVDSFTPSSCIHPLDTLLPLDITLS